MVRTDRGFDFADNTMDKLTGLVATMNAQNRQADIESDRLKYTRDIKMAELETFGVGEESGGETAEPAEPAEPVEVPAEPVTATADAAVE